VVDKTTAVLVLFLFLNLRLCGELFTSMVRLASDLTVPQHFRETATVRFSAMMRVQQRSGTKILPTRGYGGHRTHRFWKSAQMSKHTSQYGDSTQVIHPVAVFVELDELLEGWFYTLIPRCAISKSLSWSIMCKA